jgi:hypothetical protein
MTAGAVACLLALSLTHTSVARGRTGLRSSVGACAEVDSEGDDHLFSNGTWGPPRGPNVTGEFHSVSCRSASFCVAVGLSDWLIYKGGHKWSSPVSIDPGRVLDSVSCPSTSFCVAVDTSGRAVTYRG